ncbi:MAG TPA: hypothetical protein VLA88_02635 [Candidatus Saccharimonadales bacterium]|nr:hypothetical protein [Candidatus Saccharimonadales bacterium]
MAKRQTISLSQLAPGLTIVVLCQHEKPLATLRLVDRVIRREKLVAWKADLLQDGRPDIRVQVPKEELTGGDETGLRTMERESYRGFNPPVPRRQSCRCTIALD